MVFLNEHLLDSNARAPAAKTTERTRGKFARFRKYSIAERSASYRAAEGGRIAHDFRRTAVRNLERQGVSRSVAMKITGYRTEGVYRRYAIVSDADLQEATRKLAGTISGTQTGGEALHTAREPVKLGG